MKYFKHIVDATRGTSIQTLFDEFGHAGPCSYWILLEMCAEKWWSDAATNDRIYAGEFKFHARILQQSMRTTRGKMESILRLCRDMSLFSVEIDGNQISISIPKLLDLLDPDTKYNRKRNVKRSQNNRLDVDVDVDVDVDNTYVPPAEATVDIPVDNSDTPQKKPSKPKTLEITTSVEFNEHCAEFKDDWRRDFPDTDFLKTEILKAIDWLAKKKGTKKARRSKRGWNQFFTNWFKTAWDQKASAPAHGPSADAWNEQAVKVKTALNRWGDWSGRHAAEVKEFLGEGLYWLAIKASTRELRNLPANDFYIRSVIGKLKEAQQKMEQQGSPR